MAAPGLEKLTWLLSFKNLSTISFLEQSQNNQTLFHWLLFVKKNKSPTHKLQPKLRQRLHLSISSKQGQRCVRMRTSSRGVQSLTPAAHVAI